MFKFYCSSLGEYFSVASLGLPEEPRSYLAQKSSGRYALGLLHGNLPGTESSYFHKRWDGLVVTSVDKPSLEIAESSMSVDIGIVLMNSLREFESFRDLVPNPNLNMTMRRQQLLLKHELGRYLRDEGDTLPMDSLGLVSAVCMSVLPVSGSARRESAAAVLSRIEGAPIATEPLEVLNWEETEGPKAVSFQGRLVRIKRGLSGLRLAVRRGDWYSEGALTFDAENGSTLKDLYALLGVRHRHLRATRMPYWG